MEFPKTDVGEVESRPKARPRRVRVYPTRSGAATECGADFGRQNRRRDLKTERKPGHPLAMAQGDCLFPGRAYLEAHDSPFPVPEHLYGAAGELFRPRGADPGRRPAADQAEPAAGGPARPRSRPAREPRGRRDPGRQAGPRRRRPDRDGLCRPPVRPFRAPARRRPRDPARRSHRRRRRPPRHPAQGIRPDAVFAPRRRPRRARVRCCANTSSARRCPHLAFPPRARSPP